MKTKIILLFSLLFSFQLFSQAPVLTESFGWIENVSVKWQPVTGADSYNVYYTGNGQVDKKIDTQLIRSYGTYFRADIPGLKAGEYSVKVVPVLSGVEGLPSVTGNMNVVAHDRSGFSFANGRVPGAYKADGTPKDNAVVVYVTEKSSLPFGKQSRDITNERLLSSPSSNYTIAVRNVSLICYSFTKK